MTSRIYVSMRTLRRRGLALVVIASNLGDLAEAQLFRDSDAPRCYHTILAVSLLYSRSILVTIVIMNVYGQSN